MLATILGFFIEPTTQFVLEPVHTAQAYYAPHIESQEEIVSRVARETDFDPQIVRNVIDAETGGTWDCTKEGKAGEIGCLQIIPKFHPDVDPTDFEASVRYFISEYKAGRGWQWTSCNCYAYATLFLELPATPKILPNSTPLVRTLAILQYKEKHYAVVEKLTEGGFWVKEANYESCKKDRRFIKWNDPAIRGFYAPTSY